MGRRKRCAPLTIWPPFAIQPHGRGSCTTPGGNFDTEFSIFGPSGSKSFHLGRSGGWLWVGYARGTPSAPHVEAGRCVMKRRNKDAFAPVDLGARLCTHRPRRRKGPAGSKQAAVSQPWFLVHGQVLGHIAGCQSGLSPPAGFFYQPTETRVCRPRAGHGPRNAGGLVVKQFGCWLVFVKS